MTIRIRSSQITGVLLDKWYPVKNGSFLEDELELDGTIIAGRGFLFTQADSENNMITGPFDSIKGYRLVKE